MIHSVALLFVYLACNNTDDKPARILSIPDIHTYGHKYVSWFYSERLDSLINCIVDKEQGAQNAREFRRRVDTQFGRETELLSERAGRSISQSNRYYYVRYCRFSKIKQPVQIEITFDSNDKVFQFLVEVLPREAPTRFSGYKTKARLRLPFNGQWYVAAGGFSINTNHHAVSTDQRFAYDFLIKKDGFTFQNDGTLNNNYFCFDKQVVSPGAGMVVEVMNDIYENKPGELSRGAGNYIIIDHGNGEFSVLAHLKRASIVIRPGDKVEIGQLLGRCGNSGHAAQPHLHYHLQNSPVIFRGEGLPVQFQSYLVNGKEIERGEPLWNQYVMNN